MLARGNVPRVCRGAPEAPLFPGSKAAALSRRECRHLKPAAQPPNETGSRMLPNRGMSLCLFRSMKVRKPWQDRRSLRQCSKAAPSASRRLAYGFRAFAKTMKDNRNVRYP
jgi:hypothetical protein